MEDVLKDNPTSEQLCRDLNLQSRVPQAPGYWSANRGKKKRKEMIWNDEASPWSSEPDAEQIHPASNAHSASYLTEHFRQRPRFCS